MYSSHYQISRMCSSWREGRKSKRKTNRVGDCGGDEDEFMMKMIGGGGWVNGDGGLEGS